MSHCEENELLNGGESDYEDYVGCPPVDCEDGEEQVVVAPGPDLSSVLRIECEEKFDGGEELGRIADHVNADNRLHKKHIERLRFEHEANAHNGVAVVREGYSHPKVAADHLESPEHHLANKRFVSTEMQTREEEESWKVKIRNLFVADRSIDMFESSMFTYSYKSGTKKNLDLFGTNHNSRPKPTSSFFATIFNTM
jgi:hypothetical protein